MSLIPGHPHPIDEGVWRVLAPNAGMMTGPGTNSYLLDTERGLLVLDPGPADGGHPQRLLQVADQLGQPLTRVLVTHTHRDHSPAAHHLGQVEKIGPEAPEDGLQDECWRPDTGVRDHWRLSLAPGRTLRAIATPGHVSNHFCYLIEETGLLFTGDHLIQGSTVVIAPPAGSMSAYLASLWRLLDEPIATMAPGHGDLIADPLEYVRHTLRHRQAREDKVLRSLPPGCCQPVAALVTLVYDDTPAFLHPLASHSLRAHLIKLEEDGRVARRADDHWERIAE